MSTNEKIVRMGKFLDLGFMREGYKKRADRFYVLIPAEIVNAKSFPFKEHLKDVKSEQCIVKLENGKITVQKMDA